MTHTESRWRPAPSLGNAWWEVVVHGHWGRPVLWFPAENGSPHEFQERGMLDAVREAVDGGRIKVYCVGSHDAQSWSAAWKPLADRARAHAAYEEWIIWQVVPFIRDQSGGRDDIAVAGPSLGAFHALLFTLRHPHVFRRSVSLSGNYDPSTWYGWGEEDYFTNPFRFVAGMSNGHLDFVRSQAFLSLICGSGAWEHSPTAANPSTHAMAALLRDKGVDHEFYDWGPDWPHDWSSWQRQAAVYLPALG